MPAYLDIQIGLAQSLYDLVSGARLLNIYARNALSSELAKHHSLRIPKHFQTGAHARYQYAERKLSTKAKKARYWGRDADQDLVRSGKTERGIEGKYDITFRGAFGDATTGGTLVGRLNMYLPYPLKGGGKGIQPQKIVDEILAVTDDEARDIAAGFEQSMVRQITAFHGPTKFLRRGKGTTPWGGPTIAAYKSGGRWTKLAPQ